MKTFNHFFAAILGLSIVAASCSKAPERLTVSPDTAEIEEGGSIQLSANVLPSEAKFDAITWASSNPAIATVNNDGMVLAVAVGNVTITARAGDVSGSATITVKEKVFRVTGIRLNKTEADLYEGESLTLTATVLPVFATDKSVSWKSSDDAVATVDQQGKVTAVKAGKATISATTTDGAITASCELAVSSLADGIQLWANGPFWSAYNLGAKSPEEYGDFYAWAETSKRYSSIEDMGGGFGMIVYNDPEVMFDDYHTPYVAEDGETMLKYNNGKDFTELQPEDDIARIVLGEDWSIPSFEDFDNLLENTNQEYVKDYNGTGVNGWVFSGKGTFSGRSIFFPLPGECIWEMQMNGGGVGRYWSTKAFTYDPSEYEDSGFTPMPGAWTLSLMNPDMFKNQETIFFEEDARCCGLSIRPLRK